MKPLLYGVGVGIVCALMVTGCLSRQTMGGNQRSSKRPESAHASGGNGGSYETAVVITGGRDYADAVECENGFVSSFWGEKDKDWKLMEKTTMVDNGRTYDMVHVIIPKVGEKHFYYFDITHYKKKHMSLDNQSEQDMEEAVQPAANPEPRPAVRPQPVNDSANTVLHTPPVQESPIAAPAGSSVASPPPTAVQDTTKTPESK